MQNLIQRDGRRHPWQRMFTQVLAHEIALHEAIRGTADVNALWGGHGLELGANIRRHPQPQLPVMWSPTPLADDYEAGVNAHTRMQTDVVGLSEMAVEVGK